MPAFTISEHFVHPAGIYPAILVEWKEKTGQYGPRIQWVFETSVAREDGSPARVSHFTGTRFSAKSKLGELVHVLGAVLPRTQEQAREFDPSELIGAECQVEIVHNDRDGETWGDVKRMLPPRQRRPALAAKAPEEEDPFTGSG